MSLESQSQRFIEALEALGGSAGNGSLSSALGWADSTYQRIKAHLIDAGRIVPGRGRGGSVALVARTKPKPKPAASAKPSGNCWVRPAVGRKGSLLGGAERQKTKTPSLGPAVLSPKIRYA